MSSPQLTSEEHEQILQTIEMFEVITMSNPKDTKSYEILKEAYTKVGRTKDALNTARRLGELYTESGQFASALLEYESILQVEPDSADIVALMGEVEAQMQEDHTVKKTARDEYEQGEEFDLDEGSLMHNPALVATDHTRMDDTEGVIAITTPENDGNDSLARFLVQHKLVPEDVVDAAFSRVQKVNRNLGNNGLAASLIDEVAHIHSIEVEALICGILDRTKFAYIPLDQYDVDRQIVKMLPENLTLGRLIVPFDIVSRTVMIAMANPFDALGKDAVQQLFDYNIQWHLATPGAITKALRDAYRLDARD
jgi:tetratricopeptide (TPR) repeat protein